MSETQAVPAPELRDFVDLEFARRLERAETITPDCVDVLHQHDPLLQIAAAQIGSGTAFFGGVNYPANHIVGMGLYGEVNAEDVEQVEEFFRSRGVSSTIVVSPLADLSLPSLLAPRDYRIQEFNSVLIRRIRPEEPFSPPVGVEIEPVTVETIKPWAETIAKGFSEFGEISGECSTDLAGCRVHWLLWLASAIRSPEAEEAESFRRRALPRYSERRPCRSFAGAGVQTALIARRLHEAARAGCKYAVVSTLPGSGSQRNMERRGFRLAYTKLVMVRDWLS